MSLTFQVLAGLVAGLVVGLLAPPFVPAILSPIGTLFVNLIRMTVLPLVVSMLVASIATISSSRALGRTGARAMAMALVLLSIAAVGSVLVASPILDRVSVDHAAAQALQRTAPAGVAPRTGAAAESRLAQWFIDLVPPNVVRAVADDAMLPVIVFVVLFAMALGRVREDRRTPVVHVAEGVAEAMQRLLAVILAFAPIGVFALAVPLAARLGYGAISAVAVYIVLVVSLTVVAVLLLLYPLGIVGGGMRPAAFASFAAPAQAIAFSSRSGLAALGAMIESAEEIHAPAVVSGFIVPLAASTFRFGAAVGQTVGVLFLARVYGVALSVPQLASVVVAVIFASFTVPGIPYGSILMMVPVLQAVGLPADGIGILLAADVIPDMFRTTANVTGTMAVAAVLTKRD